MIHDGKISRFLSGVRARRIANLDELIDDTLGPLITYLGENTLFIPEYSGEKRPRLVGWKDLTLDTLTDRYWRALAESVISGGNIGVLLGKPSNGICTVDLDRETIVEPFLAANPVLRETLISTGSGIGAQYWFRAQGYCPDKVLKIHVSGSQARKYNIPKNPLTDTYDIGELRGAQKSTIWGLHPGGNEYRLINPRPLIELRLTDLSLPRGWHLREIRPTEFGPVKPTSEEELIACDESNRANRRKWRGGGGSH